MPRTAALCACQRGLEEVSGAVAHWTGLPTAFFSWNLTGMVLPALKTLVEVPTWCA